MNANLQLIADTVERYEPANYETLCNAVNKHCPKTWGWNAYKVFFHGYYQGVRLALIDGKGKTHYLPSKLSAYSIAQMKEDLPTISVDNTGKEIDRDVVFQVSEITDNKTGETVKVSESDPKVQVPGKRNFTKHQNMAFARFKSDLEHAISKRVPEGVDRDLIAGDVIRFLEEKAQRVESLFNPDDEDDLVAVPLLWTMDV